MAATSSSIDTVILGGGWSGLLSALRLSQAGRKVVILEARQRIGGRAFTHTWDKETGLNDDRTSDSKEWAADFGECNRKGYTEIERWRIGKSGEGKIKMEDKGRFSLLPSSLSLMFGYSES